MNIAAWAIKRPVNVWLLILICVFGGLYAYSALERLEDPEFVIKEAIVFTPYAGASAEAVEREVTDVIETAVQRMPQLDEIRSRSIAGFSEVRVEIRDEFGGDQMDQIWDELRRRLRDVQGSLPPGAGQPMVNDDFGDVFGIFYAVTGDGMTLAELNEAAKDIRRGLLTTQGVGQIEIMGVIDPEFVVEIPQARLAALRVSPQEIAQAIGDAEQELPAGEVRAGDLRLRINPSGTYDSVDSLKRLAIGQGEARVRLGDIADIRREVAEQPGQIIHYDGKPAITLGISGLSSVNIVDVGEAVEKRLERLMPAIPAGIDLHPIYNQPEVVDDAISSFLIDLLISLAVVGGILCLFMGLKAGLTISVVLVLSVAGTLLAMTMLGLQLERVSLAALVIAMGMLVDNALVIVDGFQVRLKRGEGPKAAAVAAVKATQWPLFGATLIGILAFAGVGLSQDATGEFMFSLFIVIAVSLLLSWVLAITAVPMLGYYWLAKREQREKEDEAAQKDGADGEKDEDANEQNEEEEDEEGRDPAFRGPVFDRFRTSVGFVLGHAWAAVVAAAVLTVACVWGFGFVTQSFFPPAATPMGLVDIHARQGTDIRRTNARVAELEAWMATEFPGIRHRIRLVGSGATRFILTYAPEQPDQSYAQLILLVDEADDLDPILTRFNHEVAQRFPDLDVHGARLIFGAATEADVEARFSGPDPAVLRQISMRAQAIMKDEPVLQNVRDDWRDRDVVLRPVLDLERMAETGLTRQDVAQALVTATDGAPLGVVVEGDEQRQVRMRVPHGERPDAGALLSTLAWSQQARRYVPISSVATGIDTVQEEGIIHRRNRERTISVRAEPLATVETTEAREKIVEAIEGMQLPKGYSFEWGGEEDASGDAQGALMSTLAVPYLLMFIITVLMFAAVREAVVIWLVVPMSICGVTLGLLITGEAFGFVSLLGLLSLSGLLLKNAIVLVDEIDLRIRDGVPRRTAVVEGTTSRFMPITLLGATTVLGMVPLLGDPLFSSMAVTIMGGFGLSVVLTLYVVPALYVLVFRVKGDETVRDRDRQEKPA